MNTIKTATKKTATKKTAKKNAATKPATPETVPAVTETVPAATATAIKAPVHEEIDYNPIANRAVIVRLSITGTTGTKSDKEKSREITSEAGAEQGSATVINRFVPAKVINRLNNTRSAVVNVLKQAPFLPYEGTDQAMLPIKLWERGQEKLSKAIAKWEEEVESFISDYPKYLETAPARLGTLYKGEGSLPSVDEMRGKFHCDHSILPVPTTGDFRIECEQELLKKCKASLQSNFSRVEKEVKERIVTSLREPLAHLQEHLEKEGNFSGRQATITAIQDIASIAGELNVSGDKAIEEVRVKIATAFNDAKAKDYADSTAARDKGKETVKNLMEELNGIL